MFMINFYVQKDELKFGGPMLTLKKTTSHAAGASR